MKKLTAGIFSVLMGLVSVNAAEAAVASKGYVDTKVGLKEDAVNKVNAITEGMDKETAFPTVALMETQITQSNNDLTGLIGDQAALEAQTGKSDVVSAVNANDAAIKAMDTAYKAADTTLQGNIDTLSGTVTSNKTATDAAISDMDAAYKAADSALDTRVTANTNAITGLQTSKADKGTKLSDYGITDAYTRSETDTKIADAVKGTMEGDVSTILGDYLKKTEAETIYESIAAAKATNDAQDIKITANTDALTVLNGNASVEGSVAKSISDALAPYSTTTQVQGLIESATTDMATNSSVNTALSNYTNTTDLTALLNGKQDNLSGSDAVKIDNNVVSIIADSITGAMIKDLTIETGDIKDGAVTTAKLAGGSVTAEKLGTGAVGDNAVSALSQSKITGLEDALSAKFVAPAYEAVTDNGTYVLTATKEGDEIKYAWEDITRN